MDINVKIYVNGKNYKTLCKTVINADTVQCEISFDNHSFDVEFDNTAITLKNIDGLKVDTVKTLRFKANFTSMKKFKWDLMEIVTDIVGLFADGKLMWSETIKGTCIYPNMRFVKKVTKETATAKSLLNSAYGITAERETATDHTYEIRVFKNSVFICSCTFSLESFAKSVFSIMKMNAIDFSEPCFKAIELFKDGKLVKMIEICFGKIALEVENE